MRSVLQKPELRGVKRNESVPFWHSSQWMNS
jgi:hypothetical protein